MIARVLALAGLGLLTLLGSAVAADDSAGTKLEDGFYRVWDEGSDPPSATSIVAQDDTTEPALTVLREPLLLASEIEHAEAKLDPNGFPTLAIELSEHGGEQMKIISAQLIAKRVALVVANKIVTAPMITTPMGKTLEVQGNMTMAEMKAMADRLMRR